MGVNMAGLAIVDDDAVREAAKMEIVRRYFQAAVDARRTGIHEERVERLELLMNQAGIDSSFSPARSAALLKEETTGGPAGAMVLADGRVVTGKTSPLLGAASSLLMNALKAVSGVDDDIYVISDDVIKPICTLKTSTLHSKNPRLHSDETLLALSVSLRDRPACPAASRPRGRPARMRRFLQRRSSPPPTRGSIAPWASTYAASRNTSSAATITNRALARYRNTTAPSSSA